MQNLVEFGSISPEGARVLGVIGACPLQRPDLRRHRLGQDHPAQHA